MVYNGRMGDPNIDFLVWLIKTETKNFTNWARSWGWIWLLTVATMFVGLWVVGEIDHL